MPTNTTIQPTAEDVWTKLDVGQRLGIITRKLVELTLGNLVEPIWPEWSGWPPTLDVIATPVLPREPGVSRGLHEQRHRLVCLLDDTLREFQRDAICPKSMCEELRESARRLAWCDSEICYPMTKQRFDSITKTGDFAELFVTRLIKEVHARLQALEDFWATTPKTPEERGARLMAGSVDQLSNGFNSLSEAIRELRRTASVPSCDRTVIDGNTQNVDDSENKFAFRPSGDGYDITFGKKSGHVSAHTCKGLHQIYRLLKTPLVPVLMTELEGAAFDDPHSRQDIADQETLRSVMAKLHEAKSEFECEKGKQDCDSVEVEHCRQEVEKWECEIEKLLGNRGHVRDLNNPFDKKRPKIWGTIKTALNRLQKSGFSELADHLEESIDSERAWFVYAPKRNPVPDWKTEKKDDFLRQ